MPTILVPSKSAFPIWHMPTSDFVRYLFSTRKWEESELCFKQTFLISLVLCPHLFHYFYLCISRVFSALRFFLWSLLVSQSFVKVGTFLCSHYLFNISRIPPIFILIFISLAQRSTTDWRRSLFVDVEVCLWCEKPD